MPSIEEKLAEEVRTALVNNVSGIGPRVYRAREDAINPDEGDTLNIISLEMPSRPFSDGVDDNELTLSISIFVRGDVWESKADAYAVLIHPIVVNRDYLSAQVKLARRPRRTDQDWTGDEGDATPGKRVVKYSFRFLTKIDDITAQP